MDTNLALIYESIRDGEMVKSPGLVQAILDEGIAPDHILNEGMITAMAEVGRLFELGDLYVPEMLISARAMKAGLEVLRPHLAEKGVKPLGKVVIGTVQGDLHDIGKNLVGMMLEGAGFDAA
jgi:5-methyltetrahydrofolate--homocysteine methyltransferase